MSSCDPWPIGHPEKLCDRTGACDGVDVSRERRQGGTLARDAGACVISVVRELAGRRMLAFPGNTATRHICYALSGANTIWPRMAGCFYSQTQVAYQLQNKLWYGKMFCDLKQLKSIGESIMALDIGTVLLGQT